MKFTNEMQNDPLQHWPARNFKHGLRDAFGDRAQARSLASRHYYRDVRLGGRADQVSQEMNGDKLAVMIEYGHVLNGTGLHDIKDRSSIGVGCDCKKFACHHRRSR